MHSPESPNPTSKVGPRLSSELTVISASVHSIDQTIRVSSDDPESRKESSWVKDRVLM